jgi:hypothetical protein
MTIDRTNSEMGEMFLIADIIQGQKQPKRKRPKNEGHQPIVFVNFNTR